jgi:hypothetical protein
MEEVNKNTKLDNTDKKLHISDDSDSDFKFMEIKTILKKKEDDMLWYIKEYFTEDEINRHSENLLRMVSGVDGDIAEIKMKLIRKNHYH